MDEDAVFRRYDIRGNYPGEIDTGFAEILGRALGSLAVRDHRGRTVVTKDTKDSSGELKSALVRGIMSAGAEVLDAGTGPTDYTAFTGREKDSVAVQVTSSHLPMDNNGFKMMYPSGNSFVNEDLDRLKQLFRNRDFESGEGSLTPVAEEARGDYRDRVLEIVERLGHGREREVVLETMAGAASEFLPDLLGDTGLDVRDLSSRIDPPEPSPERLGHVEQEVSGDQIGLACDMDADRVAAYFDGRWLDGNELMAVLGKLSGASEVVASVDTSATVEDYLDAEFTYTRVGDPFVLSAMQETGAGFSGEPNGHYAFADLVTYSSGTLSALLLASADLGPILEEIPDTEVRKDSVEVRDREKAMQRVKDQVEDRFEVLSTKDGVKFRAGDAEVLIRPSGSSSLLRVVSESPGVEAAENGVRLAKDMIRNG
ncbi:MAG: hypothetical protein ABEK01_02065 [Candidatus Nanohaloarchaea archaeon]